MADKSEIRTFTVGCECERFTPFRFAWLNRRGGYDTYTFRLKSTRTVTVKSAEFTGFLSRANAAQTDFGYLRGDRGRTVYDVQATEVYTVVSTWQTAAENEWLAELFTSPSVYLVTDVGQTGGSSYCSFDPIVVTSKSVDVRDKKGYGNRQLSHTIEFAKAYPTVVQRG